MVGHGAVEGEVPPMAETLMGHMAHEGDGGGKRRWEGGSPPPIRVGGGGGLLPFLLG